MVQAYIMTVVGMLVRIFTGGYSLSSSYGMM